MPTYEYECQDCGHHMEAFQSITAKPIRKCPACGKNGLQRLIGTGGGLIFKGSGFYITDYRSESYKAAAKAESGTSTEGTKKSEEKPSAAAKAEGTAAKGTEKKPAKAKPHCAA